MFQLDLIKAEDYVLAVKDSAAVTLSLPAPSRPTLRRAPLAIQGMDCDLLPLPVGEKEAAQPSQPSGSNSSISSSASTSTSSSGSSSNSDSNGMDEDFADDIPTHICGRLVKRGKHRDTGDEGLRISCPIHGSNCRKFRSLTKCVDEHGPLAPVYFLHCWAKNLVEKSMGEHAKWNPIHKDIKLDIESWG